MRVLEILKLDFYKNVLQIINEIKEATMFKKSYKDLFILYAH